MVLRLYRGLDPQRFAQWDSELRSLAAKLPSLVLWGDRDPYIPNIFAERFGAQQVLHFRECGHWPQVEIPDFVSRELVEFFSKQMSSRPIRQVGKNAITANCQSLADTPANF